jgi:hypothetical protein
VIKNKKRVILALIIFIVIGMISGFYLYKSCGGEKSYYGMKVIDWVLAGGFILMVMTLLFQIVYFLFNQEKAGEKIFTLYISSYKTRIKLLVFELAMYADICKD